MTRVSLQLLGVCDSVEGIIVCAEDVCAALCFVHTGDAAAGIVYATDADCGGRVVQIIGAFAG